MGVLRRRRHVLGIAAVAAVADVIDVGEAVVVAVVQAEVEQDALADPARRHARAGGHDAAGRIGALDARKRQGGGGTTSPGRDGIGIFVRAIGAQSHPDVRVVHAAGQHFDQHFAGCRLRHRHVGAIDKPIQAAMPGEQHGMHRRGNAIRHSPQLLSLGVARERDAWTP
jgi:hypothetical protein